MDNNERTDQFFRERLSVYEEMPVDQVWDKIASHLEMEKRKKLIYLFLRIAAGMTLLFSLGLGYHLIYKSGNQKAEAVITKPSVSEKSIIAPSNVEKASNESNNQSLIASDKFRKNESKSLQKNDNHTYLLNDNHTYTYNATHSDTEKPVLYQHEHARAFPVSGTCPSQAWLSPAFTRGNAGTDGCPDCQIMTKTLLMTGKKIIHGCWEVK